MPGPKVIRLHPAARAELQESVAFYRTQAGERWALRFKFRVAEGLRAIASEPLRYPPVPGMPRLRRFRLRQFPFSLVYLDREQDVWVVAVAHARRSPGYWRNRV